MSTPRSTTWIIIVGILAGWGAFVISIVTGFIQTRLLLAYLTDAQAGAWFVFLSLLGYIALLDFGAGVTLSRYIAFAAGKEYPQGWQLGADRQQHDPQQAVIADLVTTVSWFYALIALGVGLSASTVGLFILPIITQQPLTPQFILAWLLATLAGCLVLLNTAPSATLIGSNAIHYQQSLMASARLLGLALNFIFLVLGGGLVGVASALVIQNAYTVIGNWLLARRIHPILQTPKVGRPQKVILRQLLTPSVKMGIINLANVFSLNTDNVMIAWRLGSAAVPNYSVAFQLAYLLHSLALVISGPFVSLSAQAHAEKSSERLRDLLRLNLRFGIAFMGIGSVLYVLHSHELITLWVGADRFVGYTLVSLITLVLFWQVHTTIHFRIVTATNHIPFVAWSVGTALFNFFISYFFVGWWSLIGAILGTLVAQGLSTFWVIPLETHRTLDIKFTQYLQWMFTPLLTSGVVLIIGLVINELIKLTGLPTTAAQHLILSLPITGAGALVAFWSLVLSPNERHALIGRLKNRWPHALAATPSKSV